MSRLDTDLGLGKLTRAPGEGGAFLRCWIVTLFLGVRAGLVAPRLILSALVFLVVLSVPDVFAAQATRESGWAYGSTSGLLIQEVIEPNNSALKVQTDYAYDAFGNKLEATVSGAGITSRTSSSTYEAKGRFATSSTNALNQSESWTYDARFGVPLSHTGPNGLTTTWTYDGFGRMTGETKPDGTKTAYSYAYCTGINGGSETCPTYGTYVVTTSPLKADGTTPNGPKTKSHYDSLGRVIATDAEGFDGSWIRQVTEYDAKGRVLRASKPFFLSGGTPLWTTSAYDDLGRVTQGTMPDGSIVTYAYHGLVTQVTNDKSQTETTEKNARGETVKVTDSGGYDTLYTYDPFGNLTSITDSLGNVQTTTYDIRGRKTASTDPDMGSWTYAYNVLGELVSQTDAKSQTVTLTYDALGRLVERVETGLTSTWTYDACTKGIGKLCSTATSTGHSKTISYDSLGRPSTTQTVIDAVTYSSTTTYDSDGRIDQVTYPSGYAVKYTYTALGYLHQLKDAATSAVLWTANARDAELKLLTQTAGNGVVTTQTFNAQTSRISGVQAGASNAVADFTYSFDTIGNLTGRSDLNQSLAEGFAYDTLNRLTEYEILGGATKTVSYDRLGNILSKSDVGTYTYNASGAGSLRPHAVASISGTLNTTYSYDAVGNLTAGGGRTLTWTSFNMVASITQGTTTVSFQYDSAHYRFKQTTAAGDTLYFQDAASGLTSEKLAGPSGSVKWTDYLVADGKMVGQRVSNTPSGGSATISLRYFVLDHLGSIAVITDESGTVVERLSYDAWGKRRFPTGADDPSGSITSQTSRGFTGHEMIDAVGLVNMNGRVQEPLIGKFVSADPIIQNVRDSQSLNRFAYVRNNPLSFTDPSGFTGEDAFGSPAWTPGVNDFVSTPNPPGFGSFVFADNSSFFGSTGNFYQQGRNAEFALWAAIIGFEAGRAVLAAQSRSQTSNTADQKQNEQARSANAHPNYTIGVAQTQKFMEDIVVTAQRTPPMPSRTMIGDCGAYCSGSGLMVTPYGFVPAGMDEAADHFFDGPAKNYPATPDPFYPMKIGAGRLVLGGLALTGGVAQLGLAAALMSTGPLGFVAGFYVGLHALNNIQEGFTLLTGGGGDRGFLRGFYMNTLGLGRYGGSAAYSAVDALIGVGGLSRSLYLAANTGVRDVTAFGFYAGIMWDATNVLITADGAANTMIQSRNADDP